MTEDVASRPFSAQGDGPVLRGEGAGSGPTAIVLGHGLTATRHYTVMGSKSLPRAGYRLVSYDARGHGESDPAPSAAGYEYSELVADMEAVLDAAGAERAVVGGVSMGAATAVAFALAHPQRVLALVLVTPAYAGEPHAADLDEWDALADGLMSGGVDGFLAAYQPRAAERFRAAVLTAARQRLERHRDLTAVADALRVVPRSHAFDGLGALEAIEAPALVVASGDEADPGHPRRVADLWTERLARSQLVSEDPGSSPLAWQGARLSRTIADFLERNGLAG